MYGNSSLLVCMTKGVNLRLMYGKEDYPVCMAMRIFLYIWQREFTCMYGNCTTMVVGVYLCVWH